MLQPIRSFLSHRLIRSLLSIGLLYVLGFLAYAQAAQVTVLNQAIATSQGSGAGGTPNINGFNIPAGKNRVLFIFAAFERDHCDLATDICNKTYTNQGGLADNYARPVTANFQITARVAGPATSIDKLNALTVGGSPSGDLRFSSMDTSLRDSFNNPIPNSTFFSAESYHIALMESEINTLLGGAGSGAVTITLPDVNAPKSAGDDAILMAYVFNNVEQTDSGIVRSAVPQASFMGTGTAGNYTISAASLDAGQAPNDANDGFLVVGVSLAGLPATNGGFNTMSGYSVLQAGVTNNNGGRFDDSEPTYVTSEPDGLSASAQFRNGVVSNFTLTSSAPSGVTVSGGWAPAFTISADNADTSDAPSSYGSPSHTISGIRLGASVDADAAALASADATGDDTDGTDDENGVTMPTSLSAGQTVTIPVSIQSASGRLNAWVDWNRDGDFLDAGEQIASDQSVATGTTNLSVNVPNTLSGGASFARFRVCSTTAQCNTPTSVATTGEVEDYAVTLIPPLTCLALPVSTVGNASILGTNEFQLTPAVNSQLGAIWGNDRINLTSPFDYQTKVYLGASDGGADGMTFTLQNTGSSAQGRAGRGIGSGDSEVGSGITPSLVIELDTYGNGDNGWSDPANDHLAMYLNGNGRHNADATTLVTPVDLGNIEDGQYHDLRVVWAPISQTLEVYFDGVLRATKVVNLVSALGTSTPYWGYTASTGGLNNQHKVCNQTNPATASNNAPVISSNGGGATAAISVVENQTAVTTVTATDAESDPLTYSISGGVDAAKFAINASTGVLTFIAVPDFEAPTDSGANNVYDVQVTVSDGSGTDIQDIAVTVTNVVEVSAVPVSQQCGLGYSQDFGTGATPTTTLPSGISTTYLPYDGDGNLNDGQYALTSNPNLIDDFGSGYDNQWHDAPDHTGNTNGRMLAVNAASGTGEFYRQSFTNLVVGTKYTFSVWVTNMKPNDASLGDLPNVTLGITNTGSTSLLASTNTGAIAQSSRAAGMIWTKYAFTFIAVNNDHDMVLVNNQPNGGSGNDLALDDISVEIACDYSDAPASYGSPQHIMLSGLALGVNTDSDTGTMPSTGADADDTTGIDDEDGVFIDSGLSASLQGASLNPEQMVTVHVPVTGSGQLYAWFDWDGDGTFGNNANELVINGLAGTNQTLTETFIVPLTVNVGNLYARFRWSSDPAAASPTNAANDGEVEDYQLSIVLPASSIPSANAAAICTTSGASNAWTAGGGGYQATTSQGLVVTAIGSAPSGASWSFRSDAMNTVGDFGNAGINGVPSLQALYMWDTTPEHGRNSNANVDGQTGTLTFNFSVPVNNPEIYIDRMGGYGGSSGATPMLLSNSARISPNAANAAVTFAKVGGGNHFEVTANSIQRTPNESMVWGDSYAEAAADSTRYMAMGGVKIDGTYSSLSFDLAGVGVEGAGGDGLEFVICADTNAVPVITSNGGGVTAAISVAENQTAVTTVTATDANVTDTLSYSITGGADAAKFAINATTGVLTFVTAPDFEAPTDSGANNVYDVQVTVSDGNGGTDVQEIAVTVTDTPEVSGVVVEVRGFLQGPFNSSSVLMEDSLRVLNLIPTSQPYNRAPFNYAGTETVANPLLATSGNSAVVDWVLVELRDANNPTSILARQAALLTRNGEVVNAATGTTPLSFPTLDTDNYYVALRHRNHLGVMSAGALALSPSTTLVDFTLPATPVLGAHSRLTSGGMALMWAGDANQSNQVIANGPDNDVSELLGAVLLTEENTLLNSNYRLSGYQDTDLDLNGSTLFAGPNNDTNVLLGNVLLHPANTTFSANYVVLGGLAQ